MTFTRDQADHLAALAQAIRPQGAPRWDAAGIMAALAKVRHLSLADVALAVIRAADDRDAKTPAVITNLRSPHWRERNPDRPRELDHTAPEYRCATCNKPKDRCHVTRIADDDHEFESLIEARRRKSDPERARQIAEALKGEIRHPTDTHPQEQD